MACHCHLQWTMFCQRVKHNWVTELILILNLPSSLSVASWIKSLPCLNTSSQIYRPTVQQAEWAWIKFSGTVISNSLRPHGLQHARLCCPSPSSRACSNLHPLSQWCHPIISSSVISFSSCLQSFPVSGSFPMNQFFASDGHSIGTSASASVLPMNIQDWLSLGLVWYPCSPRGS